MESISQVAAAAAKAVWGEDTTTHKEPVSGAQGDVSKGEPYDAGNLATPQQERVEHGLEGCNNDENSRISSLTENTSSVPQKASRENEFLPLSAEKDTSSSQYSPEKISLPGSTDNTSSSQYNREKTSLPGSTDNTSSSQYNRENTSLPGSTENTSSFSRENESLSQSTQENIKFGSYETRSSEKAPQSTSEFRDDTTTNTTSTDFANKPNKRKEGLEGESFDSRPSEGLDSRPSEKLDSRSSEKLESGSFTSHPESTAPGNDTSDSRRTHVPEPESLGSKAKKTEDEEESQGTGQEYVRSSGFAADGGDFDATKPGAGREADRLFEEKGHHPGEQGSHDGHGGKDKPSLGHRLKEKLHIGKE